VGKRGGKKFEKKIKKHQKKKKQKKQKKKERKKKRARKKTSQGDISKVKKFPFRRIRLRINRRQARQTYEWCRRKRNGGK